MSNKLYSRKEFLIILGGLATLLVTVVAIISQKSFKSQKDNSEESNSVSSSNPDLKPTKKTITTIKPGLSREFDIYIYDINGDKNFPLEFVRILPESKSEFKVGSPPEEAVRLLNEQQQTVKIKKSFYMSRLPITQAQWEAVMGKNPSTFEGEKDRLPVETVSWYDAEKFCQKLTEKTGKKHRLPSEVEWEYACRAGTSTPFYFGNDINHVLANYDNYYDYIKPSGGTYKGKTTPVGDYPANKFGLQDMHGNVWEWCMDSWHYNYSKDQVDETPYINKDDDQQAVIRGGAWHSFPSRCRSAAREFMWKKVRSNRIGFRIVREE
jgi:Uncharacterized conserved protein